MKTINILFISILICIATLSMIAQHNHDDKKKSDMKNHSMSDMMGKPTVDTIVERLHMKVWMMTQKQHKKMMKNMKGMMKQMMESDKGKMNHDGKEMNKEMMSMNKAENEAMMAGTHHIMFEAKDSESGKAVAKANAQILIEFPSKKQSFIDLKPMMGHFAESLTLKEKGSYRFTVSLNDSGFTREKRFTYVVK